MPPKSGPRQVRIQLPTLINGCVETIELYQLTTLLARAKSSQGSGGFAALNSVERELLNAGLVSLGDALTFCRDKKTEALKHSGIIMLAQAFIGVRNHFVHAQPYRTSYDDIQGLIDNKNMDIGLLTTALEGLRNPSVAPAPINLEPGGVDAQKQKEVVQESSGAVVESTDRTEVVLEKKAKSGKNNFPFNGAHAFSSLEIAFKELSENIDLADLTLDASGKRLDPAQMLSCKAMLENSMRNVLTIIQDISEVIGFNITDKVKREFSIDHGKEMFFYTMRDARNALSHPYDESLEKPYEDTNLCDIMRFSQELMELKTLGYDAALKTASQVSQAAKEQQGVREQARQHFDHTTDNRERESPAVAPQDLELKNAQDEKKSRFKH